MRNGKTACGQQIGTKDDDPHGSRCFVLCYKHVTSSFACILGALPPLDKRASERERERERGQPASGRNRFVFAHISDAVVVQILGGSIARHWTHCCTNASAIPYADASRFRLVFPIRLVWSSNTLFLYDMHLITCTIRIICIEIALKSYYVEHILGQKCRIDKKSTKTKHTQLSYGEL